MTNKKANCQFVKQLSEFLASGMTLRDSLKIMSQSVSSKRRTDVTTLAAREIYAFLENGSFFSNALSSCSVIKFDNTIISFMATAEQTGKVRETVDFLRQRAERIENVSAKFMSALIYPLFVVAVTFAGGLAFVFFGNQIAQFAYGGDVTNYQHIAAVGVIRSAAFLACVLLFCAFLFFQLANHETEYDVFAALNFLTSANVHLSSALDSALVVAKNNSRLAKKLFTVKIRLDSGVSPADSFVDVFDKVTTQSLYNSCKTGNEQKMFATASSYISQRNELYWKKLVSLVEPFFIVVAGVCLMIVISSTVLPLISNLGLTL